MDLFFYVDFHRRAPAQAIGYPCHEGIMEQSLFNLPQSFCSTRKKSPRCSNQPQTENILLIGFCMFTQGCL